MRIKALVFFSLCFSVLLMNGCGSDPGSDDRGALKTPVPPHPLDRSYLVGNIHGPDALADLATCQVCHGNPPSGRANGFSPVFNAGIISAGTHGCEGCHNDGTAHPSAVSGGRDSLRWYDAVQGDPKEVPGGNFGVSHNRIAGSPTAISACFNCHILSGNDPVNSGPDCLYCHVDDPSGTDILVGTCSSCHGSTTAAVTDRGRPNGNQAPNRRGEHQQNGHRFECIICHTSNGPDSIDGTIDDPLAAGHFTYPSAPQAFSRAGLRSTTLPIGGNIMSISIAPGNVTCTGNCHINEVWY